MIFLYIKELQNRIILLFIAYICLLCSLFFYKEVLLFVVVLPVLKSTGSTMFYFIYTNFSELFEVYLYLSFLFCNFVFYILLLFHVICFLMPGLLLHEKNKIKLFFSLNLLFVIISFCTLNYLIIPLLYEFFRKIQEISFNNYFNFYLEARLVEYVVFYAKVLKFEIWCSIFYIILYIYITLKDNKINFLKKSRRFIYLFFIVNATLFSPPDICYQLFIFLITTILYEVVVLTLFINSNLTLIKNSQSQINL